MITIDVSEKIEGFKKAGKDIEPLANRLAYYAGDYIATQVKDRVFSNNPVKVITGITRGAIGVKKTTHKKFQVGVRGGLLQGRYAGYLGRLEKKYGYKKRMASIASGQDVIRIVDKVVDMAVAEWNSK